MRRTMNAELQQLKDIHLPHAINTWAIAPGWTGLFVLLFGTLCFALFFWHKSKQKNYTVNFALAKLEKLHQLILKNPGEINVAAEISTLLRRTALYYFHREDIAGLSGKHWLHFLNRTGNTTNFTQETGRLLIDTPYRKDNCTDLTPLFALSRAWLITISKKNVIAGEK
jgi:hypothetical protein